MKKLMVICLLVCMIVPCLAETRGAPYTPEQFHKMSTLVFEGTVTKIETVEKCKKTFPTSAKISNVLKGTLKEKNLSFKHKDPGRCVIFEEEFNTPKIGQEGTFYLQNQGGALVLIGYIKKTEPKEIRPIDKSNIPDKKSAVKAFIQKLTMSKENGLSSTQRIVAHGHFTIGFRVKDFADKGDRVWQIHLIGLDQTVDRIFWLNAETKNIHQIAPERERKT